MVLTFETRQAYNSAELGRDHSLDALCELVMSLFDVPMAAVSLINEDVTHYLGFAGIEFGDVANEHTFCSYAVQNNFPFLIEDTTKDVRFANNPFVVNDPHIRMYLGSPLIAPNGTTLGAICALDVKPRSYTAEEQRRLQSLANTAVQLLEMRRMMKQANDMALVDGMTKLANRRSLEAEIEKAITVLNEQSLPFSLLYFDVDYFKQINDQNGHAAGDKLLKLIGQTLSARAIRDEVHGRLGGDEFVVLMLNTTLEAAVAKASEIKQQLDDVMRLADIPVSFSMGLTNFVNAPESAEAALNCADERLYKAKRAGKNQIVFS
ncbi:diguanylate cyclase (GGDEF)-like protein [Paenochrobactrum gallinarii]|uniref:diguanylate cyclase n=1 Tax=Paenochrobactrum gallinarii TaxID=643673 RepID=A0A841LWD6_9HYPH|nr:sensor domain-containing diguanylate cyclase [Paenochrobactrum gallinarii]MBB6260807.1 diguanylate cyclase (GGDEF)-like protein [Paenochrobactrum gallinarii]